MKTWKTLNSQNNLERGKKIAFPDFNLQYKAAAIKTVQYCHKKRQIDQCSRIESIEMNPHFHGSKSTIKKAKIFNEGKTVSSINGVGKLDSYRELFIVISTFSISIIKIIKMDYFSYHIQRFLRVPWTTRRSNQSILKEINPVCSLEGLLLKLSFSYSSTLAT